MKILRYFRGIFTASKTVKAVQKAEAAKAGKTVQKTEVVKAAESVQKAESVDVAEISGKGESVKRVREDVREEIRPREFDGNEKLRHFSVPSVVKKIGRRAFADCKNLETLDLPEGLETIERNAFTGCSSLKKLTLPDSIRDVDGWAFYNCTGLEEPVYNRSETILYAYPCSAQNRGFAVPEQVKEINPAAFLNNLYLEELIFPEGIEILKTRTVIDCSLRKVTIPISVKKIEAAAFMDCEKLEKVLILGKDTVIEKAAFCRCAQNLEIVSARSLRWDEQLHLQGKTLLVRTRTFRPGKEHWKEPQFLDYAKKCAAGDADAMWKFAEYFGSLGEETFYQYMANFWRYRAEQKGCAAAKKWLNQWLEEHKGEQIPAPVDEFIDGSFSGEMLYQMGFLFFNPERSYSVEACDSDGVVQVKSWSSEDGPDEDGFGREEYYDWWYLDENLCEIPGVKMIHDYSHRERRIHEEMFQKRHDEAAKVIRERRNVT